MGGMTTDVEYKEDLVAKPYLHVRKVGEQFEASGTPTCLLSNEHQNHEKTHHSSPFVEWIWDDGQLQVRNDRFGMYPAYYFERENEIGISTSIPTLLAKGAPLELDDAALAIFLRLGFFIGDDTPFRAIRALPPNTTFRWQDGNLSCSGTGSLGKPAGLSREGAIDSYIALFRAAVRRRLPLDERFAVPLSGGRDSRHIVFELCDAGYPPPYCLTYRHEPPRANRDATVAAMLSEVLGLRQVILDPMESRFKAEVRKNHITNFCTDEHSQLLVMIDYIRGRFSTVYDGIGGGDVFSSGWFLDPTRLALFEQRRFRELAENFFDSFPVKTRPGEHETLLARLLSSEQYRRFSRDIAISRLSDELSKYEDAPNPVGAFVFWNRSRRETALAPYCMLSQVTNVLCPYLDYELHDFLASLPARMLLDHKLHTDTIRRAYPRYANIPFEEDVKGPPIPSQGYFRKFWRELACAILAQRSSQFIRSSYLLPRLLRCVLDENYGKTMFSSCWLGPHILYLLQLERTIGNAARDREQGKNFTPDYV